MFIDSHFHSIVLKEKTDKILLDSINYGLDIALSADEYPLLIKDNEKIYNSLGLYPSFADKDDDEINNQLNKIENILKNKDNKLKAIGEIGLDHHYKYDKNKQIEIFIAMLNKAKKYDLPVVIHCRNAFNALIPILKQEKHYGVIHCFDGDREIAKKLLDLNFYLSYSGILTYKKNTYLQDTLNYMPKDKILFETDAPFLAPQNKRGKINHPSYVQYNYEFASKYLDIDLNLLIIQIEKNFKKLFKI